LPLVDARRALLQRLFDHAPLFPPASMSLPDALDEDRRARAGPDAWMLLDGRRAGAAELATAVFGELGFV
jgi:hypothetical protein